MEKIKRNKIAENSIRFTAGALSQTNNSNIPLKSVDNILERYKETCRDRYMFTVEEAESIMQVLRSMPGYSPEKFLIASSVIDCGPVSQNTQFSQFLYSIYIILSMTNPELFEDYEEETHTKDY